MVDAAVSGGPSGAQRGQLSVIVGGREEDVNSVRGVLQCFAKAITHVGPLGAGHAVKAMNNVLNASHLLLASEAMCALSNFGIDPQAALAAINLSSGRSLISEQRLSQEVFSRRFAYGFKLGLMHKDVTIANRILDQAFPSACLMRQTMQLMDLALQQFGYNADYTEAVRVVEERARVTMRPTAERVAPSSVPSANDVSGRRRACESEENVESH